ncbi:pyridoxamine 5'-phosphate oxidase [Pararhodobacter zhoushanensis]|uniref:Pyridoxine/pyridoxamine 5'-phosphate oxidase n=1 Tax=Pararhodobacter zhoushanensis TaxID=2479545 RepID=A0ABT3GY65_9RHOB|nr:pyridoxamine 5'-phosphate oxidase [Pararhodobacter zhoushanensis]MCW1932476.1 pyridoxamine 5'-phosphate oxidase [Pararhodobacter zhoushanensis]
MTTSDSDASRTGIFVGDDPFALAQRWLTEAEASEPNDPNAIALSTVDSDGLPNVRMVLLKEIEQFGDGTGAFVFYTNYRSAKAREIEAAGKAAFVMHWKSLRRQIRVRGLVAREDGPQADAYYASRSLQSRLGAWASQQSQPLASRGALMADVAKMSLRHGTNPPRPPYWGGFRITPVEIEFWADGAFRLHDRFRFTRLNDAEPWVVSRLNP